jgi:hypothetical protein
VPDELNEKLKAERKAERLLDWLYFAQMGDRESEITDAYESTFQWALQHHKNGPRLAKWLRDGNGLFWIQGRLGSGKSTLMKYVWESKELERYLTIWASDQPLHRACFFFWKKGASELQKSLQGLYRSLVASLIRSNKDLVDVAFPNWRPCEADLEPTAATLRSALRRILNMSSLHGRYCFFIDGLDEYDEQDPDLQNKLAQGILDLAALPGVKILVASRPEASFIDRFAQCPTLRLQDCTAHDIWRYVTGELRLETQGSPLDDDDNSAGLSSLAEAVVSRANGVFLWVKLVVADLVVGIQYVASYDELQRKLDGLHDDLNDLFKQILIERILPEHQKEVARSLLILDESHKISTIFISLTIVAVGREETDPMDRKPDPLDIKATRQKTAHLAESLPVRSRGLILTHRNIFTQQNIDLVHSSLYDYIAGENVRRALETQAGHFNARLAYVSGAMAEIAVFHQHEAERLTRDSRFDDLILDILHFLEEDTCQSGIIPHSAITRLDVFLRKDWRSDMTQYRPLLPLTIMKDCTFSIRREIELNRGLPQTHDRPLLFYAVSKRRSLATYRAPVFTKMRILSGLKGDGPLQMLLQHGADPNEVYQGQTPWGQAFAFVRDKAGTWQDLSSGMNQLRDGEHWALEGFLCTLGAAKELLRYGADPDLHDAHFGPSTAFFASLLNGNCCDRSLKLASCPCGYGNALRSSIVELVELAKEKSLEKRLGPLLHLGKLGIQEAQIWWVIASIRIVSGIDCMELLRLLMRMRMLKADKILRLLVGLLMILVLVWIWSNKGVFCD